MTDVQPVTFTTIQQSQWHVGIHSSEYFGSKFTNAKTKLHKIAEKVEGKTNRSQL